MDFFLADHTPPTRPEPAWQKMAQSPLNDSKQPVEIEGKSRHPQATDRQWLKISMAMYGFEFSISLVASMLSDF